MARSQQGIRAGKAFVELYANDTSLVRGLRSAQRKLKQFSATVTSMGTRLVGISAVLIAPIVAATKSFADFGDSVQKAAARTGLSAQAISGLGFAAEQSGADIGILEAGFRGMARNILNAQRGLSTAVDTFADLGISIETLQHLSPEDQFKLIAERVSQIDDPTRKAAIAMAIFGRSGQMLVPMLDAGASGIEAMQKEAEQLGITLSQEDADAAAELTDAMNRMRRAMRGAWLAGGSVLAEGMTKIFNSIAQAIPRINTFAKENKLLLTSIAAGVAVVGALGSALIGLGAALTLASIAIGGIATVLAVLSSPIGIAIAGLTAFAAWSVKSGKAVEFLQSKFPKLTETVKDAFAVIKNAMAGGDIVSAARVMWAAINLEWTRGINAISKKWTQFSTMAMQAAMLISAEQAQQERASAAEEAEQRLKQAQQAYEDAKKRATQADKEKPSEVNAAINGGGLSANAASNLVSQGGTFSSLSSREFVSMSSLRQKNPSERIVESVDKLTREVMGVRRLIDDFGVQP